MKPQATTGSKFNRRIAIQALDNTLDSSGGAPLSYTTIAGLESVPASIVYPPPSKKGDENYQLQQVQESLFATITIRYRPTTNISPAYQVKYGSRLFNIRSVFVDAEARRIIVMQCEELQAKGTLH